MRGNPSAGRAETNWLSQDNVTANGFPAPIVSRVPDQEGIGFAMLFQPTTIGAPTVPVQPRSSLAQLVIKHRIQVSHYFSRYRTNGYLSLPALIGYPAAKGHKMVNTSPPQSRRPSPVTSGRAPARPSTMAPPPRWRKAMPVPVVPFSPPLYGTEGTQP